VSGAELWTLFVLPVGLGLFGFIEPCSLGATLLFVKYLEGRGRGAMLGETLLFMLTRGVFIGTLGVVAALIGGAFIAMQKGAWIVFGLVYAALGAAMLVGHADRVMLAVGPRLSRFAGRRATAGLGVLFGLNIPACAAPLLAALLGTAAAGAASGSTLAAGFVSLGVFGLALSLPLIVAVMFERARSWLERLARWGSSYPRWAGLVLVLLGAWSIRFGLADG
jgi:cytochrome c-type biogenesis protein